MELTVKYLTAIACTAILALALTGLAGAQTVNEPNAIHVKRTTDLTVPDNQMVPVPWEHVLFTAGDPPATLDANGDLVFARDCWCVVDASMDWPLVSQGALRRMDVRWDVGNDGPTTFDLRIGGLTLGPNSGDGWAHSTSSVRFFEQGDRVYVEVRHNNTGETHVLQATYMTRVQVTEWPE